MHRSYVRAYEHRSMAVALPFVMHRLVPGEGGILGENCAISFIMWRNALDKLDYVEQDAPTSHVNVTSLETVERLGRKLQVDMNALKNFLSDVPDDEFEGKKRHQFHATITHVYSHPQTTKSSPLRHAHIFKNSYYCFAQEPSNSIKSTTGQSQSVSLATLLLTTPKLGNPHTNGL